MRLVFILLVFGCGLVASLGSRFAALLLYLWLSFFRPQDWAFWSNVGAFHMSQISFLVLVIPAFLAGKIPSLRNLIAAAMAVLVCCAFIAELATPHPRSDWYWLTLVADTALVDLLLIRLVDTARRLKILMVVVLCSIGFHTAKQGLVFLTTPGFKVIDGAGGSYPDNNSYAVVCAMTAVLLLSFARSMDRQWQRLGFTVAGILTLLTVIATFSRGGFLAAVAALCVYALCRGLQVKWVAGAALVATLFVWFVSLPEAYVDRLKTMQTYEEDESAMGRLYFWNVAVDMAWHEPLGVGVQNFNAVFDMYDPSQGREHGSRRSVHNSHLQVLTEAGMMGFVTWALLLIGALTAALRSRRRARANSSPDKNLYLSVAEGTTAALAAFIVGGTFTAIAWNDFVWCVLAIIAVVDRLSKRELVASGVEAGAIGEGEISWADASTAWQPASAHSSL
jgi:probable O-glycosylation ligase (exosortase A-associated)